MKLFVYILLLLGTIKLCDSGGAIGALEKLDSNTKNRPKLSPKEKFLRKLAIFSNATTAVRGLEGYQEILGDNLKESVKHVDSLNLIEYVKKKAKRGVVLNIENLSDRILGSPKIHVRCGWKDDKFGKLSSIKSRVKDVIVLHNFYKPMRSSCGGISWQIQDKSGHPWRFKGNYGMRLYLTWSTLDTGMGRNKCKDNKRNEFVAGFEKVLLDREGNEQDYDINDVYGMYHLNNRIQEAFPHTDHSSVALIDSLDGEMEVKVLMSPGCISRMDLTLLGKGRASIKPEKDEEQFTPDAIWEQMIRQAWLDIVRTINKDKALYGIKLTPMELDPLLAEPIAISEDMAGYQVDLAMWNISIHGVDTMSLDKLILERGEALDSVREEAVINLGDIIVMGMYQYTAECTNWFCIVERFDSEGQQPFKIQMSDAKFKVIVNMDTINGCEVEKNLVISEISLPLEYSSVEFDFTNIGSVLGTIVDTIGTIALSFSQGIVVQSIQALVLKEVPSFICNNVALNSTKIESIPATADKSSDPVWYDILLNATNGWGWDELKRDFLAEQFMNKAVEEGLGRHLKNDSDPLVQLLDPFQLLPASEDIHEKGLFKGHIVACELWLKGLRNLKMTEIQLVRNDDLTFSGLKLMIELPFVKLNGKFRLNNVFVFGIFHADDSEGTIDATISGVKVELTCVLETDKIFDQGESQIKIKHFAVDFKKEDAEIDVRGIGGKVLSKITNKGIKAIGEKIIDMQKKVINTEIRNILWGMVKCLMYNPGTEFQKCQDEFWGCLGFKVPFEFPKCSTMYKEADEEIAKYSSYRKYLKAKKEQESEEDKNFSRAQCLTI